jgi:hypothetical protein
MTDIITTANTYEWLLVQLRVLADGQGDHRSLVAIAAQFERHIDEHQHIAEYVKASVKRCRHNRNAEAA